MENNGSLAVCLLLIYVFVFNNVRADCKTMFCLINEDESKTKNVGGVSKRELAEVIGS